MTPVVAVDPNDDTLTYQRMDILDSEGAPDAATAGDAGHFSIDKATGQLSRKSKLDYDSNSNGYKFLVVATDPSGERDEVEVTVNATAANDAPQIMGSLTRLEYENHETNSTIAVNPDASSEIRVFEKDDDLEGKAGAYTGQPGMPLPAQSNAGLGADNVFTAADEDARGQIFWALRGEDADQFVRSQTEFRNLQGLRGPDEPIAIRFRDAPDYENPGDANADSVYKVILVATDSSGAEDTRDLTIFVDNVNEAGQLALSTDQPLVGEAVTATVSDPDNSVTVVTWQWSRADTRDSDDYKPIPGATSATYVPWKKAAGDPANVDDDDSMFLQATATYLDTTSHMDMSSTGNVDERVQEGEDDPEDSANLRIDDAQARNATSTKTGEGASGLYRVSMKSVNAVGVAVTSEEDTPTFPGAPYDRMVAENSETGKHRGPASHGRVR